MKPLLPSLLLAILLLLLAACAPNPSPASPPPPSSPGAQQPTPPVPFTPGVPPVGRDRPSATPEAEEPDRGAQHSTPPGAGSDTPTPQKSPAFQTLPIIPTLSPRALEIYRTGLALGNNPRAFSKIGDCESAPDWFLADFDKGPRYYNLGPYTNLQPVIDYFSGSYRHISLAVKPGFTATSVLTPLWADPQQCRKDETPLACEYRIQNPAFAVIMLGSNNAPRPETFEPQMRKILDQTIARGTVPILVTKADNLEGDHSINQTIARLAREYDIPLWNFWAAVQPLPHHGLQDDGAHLTWAANRFDDPGNLDYAWPVRNLTALQVLDVMMKSVAGQ